MLSIAESWYLDGTFDQCPQLFYQLVILHGETVEPSSESNWHFPLVYFLVIRKDAATYENALTLLIRHCSQSLSPRSIMCDFEMGLRSAIRAIFPSSILGGCFYHFTAAVYRNLVQLGYKQAYATLCRDPITNLHSPSEFRVFVRRLMMLPFVPTHDVLLIFEEIVGKMPLSMDCNALVSYFMATWIRSSTNGPPRYPINTWNQVERTKAALGRTNNICESFNNSSSLVGHSKPTIWSFIDGLRLTQSATQNRIMEYRIGRRPPPRTSAAKKKDEAVVRMLEQYNSYSVTNTVFKYLDVVSAI